MVKKPIYLACFLAVIGIICAGLIASVNTMTAPIISEREKAEKEATILDFFPSMTRFEESDTSESEEFKAIQVIYNIYDQDNDCMGRIYELATKGYGGDIQMFVAYDLKTKVLINLRYIGTFSETPGFGSRVKEDEFLSQILNKPVDGMSIDTLSGATITSSAVKKAIDEANAHFLKH